MTHWEFKMVVYAGTAHENDCPPGAQLLIVTHADIWTAQLEMQILEKRMATRAVGHVDVFDLRQGELTQMNVNLLNKWKGMKT